MTLFASVVTKGFLAAKGQQQNLIHSTAVVNKAALAHHLPADLIKHVDNFGQDAPTMLEKLEDSESDKTHFLKDSDLDIKQLSLDAQRQKDFEEQQAHCANQCEELNPYAPLQYRILGWLGLL